MNKRQKKKQIKKRLGRYYSGADFGSDFPVAPNTIAELICKQFSIPSEVMKSNYKSFEHQWQTFLKMNEDDIINGTAKKEPKGLFN